MNQAAEPEVFVVVLNWNGWRDTVECLESLQQLEYPGFRMVVVDNGSSDDSWARINAWAQGREGVRSEHVDYHRENKPLVGALYDRVEAEEGGTVAGEAALSGASPERALTLIRSTENRGFAGGCNIGIRYALKREAKYLWLLNNDTVVDPRVLAEMVALARSDERVGLVGSVLVYYHDPRIVQAYGGGSVNWWLGTSRFVRGPKEGELDYLTGASLLIDTAVVESVGLLDESYFFYWEDIAYSQRALRAGWRLGVAEGGRVLHKEGGTISGGERVKSLASDRFAVRSMILFFGGFGGARWPIAVLVRLGGMVLNRLRRKQADRVVPLLKVAAATFWEIAPVNAAKRAFRRTVKRLLLG